MSHKRLAYNGSLRLAETIAALLAEGTPLTAKEIANELSRRRKTRPNASGIARALREGAEFHGFSKQADNRWAIIKKQIPE